MRPDITDIVCDVCKYKKKILTVKKHYGGIETRTSTQSYSVFAERIRKIKILEI